MARGVDVMSRCYGMSIKKKLNDVELTYLPHLTSEYKTMKSPSWSPFALTKSPIIIKQDLQENYKTT